jgi:hypothetical protein
MSHDEAVRFLRERGVCIWCHQGYASCDARLPDDYSAHDFHWRVNNVTSRRPWWSCVELARIIQRSEATK